MKQLIVLTAENCGYCKKAKMLIRRALEKEPKFIAIDLRYINEESTEGVKLPHTLVPALFVDGALLFEGNPAMETIQSILTQCYEANETMPH